MFKKQLNIFIPGQLYNWNSSYIIKDKFIILIIIRLEVFERTQRKISKFIVIKFHFKNIKLVIFVIYICS
jgi:hypothetical protein